MTKMRDAFMALSASFRQIGRRSVDRRRQPLLLAEIAGALPELRTTDAGRAMMPDQVAVGVLAGDVVDEKVLGDDHITLQAHHFGDVGDAPRAVAQARRL